MPQISFPIKNMAKINIAMRFNVTEVENILTTRYRKNSSMMLKMKGATYQCITKLNQNNILPQKSFLMVKE